MYPYHCVILLFALLLSSCAGKLTLMKNSDGDIQKCEVSTMSAMTTGMLLANRDINRCVDNLEKAGYKKIN